MCGCARHWNTQANCTCTCPAWQHVRDTVDVTEVPGPEAPYLQRIFPDWDWYGGVGTYHLWSNSGLKGAPPWEEVVLSAAPGTWALGVIWEEDRTVLVGGEPLQRSLSLMLGPFFLSFVRTVR